ncbi:AAA family ATPase [Ramlibacter albus]|uniref:Cytidylate kinase-like family protein n=1 Tax=Ramlibacter albus TaxID=2079448 RepID=A0A923S0V7_9BURK|nr:cytidylate kinase-like family protein [Ramlibacter albus]MBC5763774.1 cytidylate kinase-like family protein [Ramlibacter albus]
MPAKAICISRAIWTRAETIAANVARELGYRCIDEEILTVAAEKRNLSAAEVADSEKRKGVLQQFVDDIRRGGVGEMINYIPGQRTLPTAADDVRVVIRDAILETVDAGNVVIVAHAASYAAGSRKDVLRVLITGSPMARATRWVAQSNGKGIREAQETIAESDEARASYIRRFYGVEHEAPDDYDLVVSTDKLTPESITQLILQAARSLDADHPDVNPPQTGWDLPPTPRSPAKY